MKKGVSKTDTSGKTSEGLPAFWDLAEIDWTENAACDTFPS